MSWSSRRPMRRHGTGARPCDRPTRSKPDALEQPSRGFDRRQPDPGNQGSARATAAERANSRSRGVGADSASMLRRHRDRDLGLRVAIVKPDLPEGPGPIPPIRRRARWIGESDPQASACGQSNGISVLVQRGGTSLGSFAQRNSRSASAIVARRTRDPIDVVRDSFGAPAIDEVPRSFAHAPARRAASSATSADQRRKAVGSSSSTAQPSMAAPRGQRACNDILVRCESNGSPSAGRGRIAPRRSMPPAPTARSASASSRAMCLSPIDLVDVDTGSSTGVADVRAAPGPRRSLPSGSATRTAVTTARGHVERIAAPHASRGRCATIRERRGPWLAASKCRPQGGSSGCRAASRVVGPVKAS